MSSDLQVRTAAPATIISMSLFVLLIANLFLTSYRLTHVVVGFAIAALFVAHIWTHRKTATARAGQFAFLMLIAATATTATISGVLTWQGVAAAREWHSYSATLLVLLAVGHAWHRHRAHRA